MVPLDAVALAVAWWARATVLTLTWIGLCGATCRHHCSVDNPDAVAYLKGQKSVVCDDYSPGTRPLPSWRSSDAPI